MEVAGTCGEGSEGDKGQVRDGDRMQSTGQNGRQ
jgi:hypothetical protein